MKRIEVLIVVFGLLAVILLTPFILKTGVRARENSLRANLKEMRTMIVTYELHHGDYPPLLEALTQKENKTTGRPYLDEIPVDPMTGTSDYDYDPDTGTVHSRAEGLALDGTLYQDL